MQPGGTHPFHLKRKDRGHRDFCALTGFAELPISVDNLPDRKTDAKQDKRLEETFLRFDEKMISDVKCQSAKKRSKSGSADEGKDGHNR